ncbi:methyltransferase domain-containing protein [Paenibacillus sp. N4]|uniref:methyltransferase domain-containing protein n=1 Tax=Paenibacillus vietnamensis TaxID=2590547 RepID=UPI001CD0955B|nr:methyltransferase domain-containing protein [Paenibacillus vietnamensis]MCA0755179.1 methyltransferase domain-containing protein [Paenibacillus vietnamensis]
MDVLWPLSGIQLACTNCKTALEYADVELACRACGLRYPMADGLPNMLTEGLQGSAEERDLSADAVQKAAVQGVYDAINRTLEEKGISRFSTFINWGYASREDGADSGLPGVNQSFVRLLREIIGSADVVGKDVLEIGCGRGGNVRELCKSYRAGSVVGIDLTPSNIGFCHRSNRYRQAYYCIGDAERLPVRSGCCDFVLNVESSHLYPNIGRFFAEAYRVLKPGGMLWYADIMDAPDALRYEELWGRLGFRTALCRDITDNVLLSADRALNSRLYALGGSFGSGEGTMEWLEAPGTQKHEAMKTGKRLFKIVHLVKPNGGGGEERGGLQ